MFVIDSSDTEDEDIENVPVVRDVPVPIQEVPDLVGGFWVTPELAGNKTSDPSPSVHTPGYFLREGMNLLLDAIEIRQNILPCTDEQKSHARLKKVVFAKDVTIIPEPVGADVGNAMPTVEVIASNSSSFSVEAIASTSSALPIEVVASTSSAWPIEAAASTSSDRPIEAVASTSSTLPEEANVILITVPADKADESIGPNEEAIVPANQESVDDGLSELNTPIRTAPSVNGVYFVSPTEAIDDFILDLLNR